jgi:holin-like protein
MIAAVAGLLLCQLLGEVLVRALALPVPGPVAGMGLMFAFLSLRGRRLGSEPGEVPEQTGAVADVLLKNLSLLFIPAATGIVQYFGLLGRFGRTITIAIVVSTTAAMVVTVLVFRLTAALRTHWRRDARSPVEPE